jgi:undecaprenyl diphosphate synthase
MSAIKVVPDHIAIIMDGNGRWARARKLPRVAGHRQGAESVKKIVRRCHELNVKFLTLYTFSTENWKRPSAEINFLMQFLGSYLEKEIQDLRKNNMRFKTIGDIKALPQKAREVIEHAVQATEKNTGMTLVLALNYGARSEILNAALSLARDISAEQIAPADVDEAVFSRYLYTAGVPDPDLLIRTSGEMRISNFLLWQLSYAELYVTETMWPDFGAQELDKALADFQTRKRRFGAL